MFRTVLQNTSLDKTKSQIQAQFPQDRILGVEESFKILTVHNTTQTQQAIALGCHMIQSSSVQHLLPRADTYCVSGTKSASPGLQHST